MFKFGFDNAADSEDTGTSDIDAEDLKWFEAEEVHLQDHLTQSAVLQKELNTVSYGCYQLVHVSVDSTITSLLASPDQQHITEAEKLHSDLLPAKYEGGLKVWECTHDLATFLASHPEFSLCGKKVLDLGCGAGLLGLLALVQGASEVHFQDYNISVLKGTTMENVVLNTAGDSTSRCRYFAGDWQSYLQLTDKEFSNEIVKFDYILSSETIYNPSNYKKLCSVFRKRLKRTGTIFLAAKTYYFGVGGGVRQFEKLLEEDGVFKSSVCWKCSEGVKREILKITFKME